MVRSMVSREDLILNTSFEYLLVDVCTSEILDEAFVEVDLLAAAPAFQKEDPTRMLCIYERKSVLVI